MNRTKQQLVAENDQLRKALSAVSGLLAIPVDEIRAIAAENDRLRAVGRRFVDDVKSGGTVNCWTCTWCGDGGISNADDKYAAAHAHDCVCPSNPLIADNAKLRAALLNACGVIDYLEGISMVCPQGVVASELRALAAEGTTP